MKALSYGVHVRNCLCYRDKPPAMQHPDGGEDPGCTRLQAAVMAILSDIHAAWLALADRDIAEANRLLVKWVELYRDNDCECGCHGIPEREPWPCGACGYPWEHKPIVEGV